MGNDLELKVEECASLEELRGIQKEWDDLALREELGPAHTFEWLNILQQVHREVHSLILVLRRGHDFLGCAPMVLKKERRKGLNARVLQSLNAFHQLRGTQLTIAGMKKLYLERLMESLRTRHKAWDVWFMYFQDGEEQAQLFEEVSAHHGFRFTKTPASRSPYLPLEGSWEDALKQMQPRFRTTLRSRERKLKEKGDLELRYFNGDPDWRQGLEVIQAIERESWKVREGMPITHPFHWNFYTQFAQVAALDSSLRLPVLYLSGEPLAYDFAVYSNNVYYLLQTSFKEKWKADYPGFVLRKLIIEELYRQGAREIDFGGSEDEWKMKWTRLVRSQVLYTVYNKSAVGIYLYGWNRADTLMRTFRKIEKKAEP